LAPGSSWPAGEGDESQLRRTADSMRRRSSCQLLEVGTVACSPGAWAVRSRRRGSEVGRGCDAPCCRPPGGDGSARHEEACGGVGSVAANRQRQHRRRPSDFTASARHCAGVARRRGMGRGVRAQGLALSRHAALGRCGTHAYEGQRRRLADLRRWLWWPRRAQMGLGGSRLGQACGSRLSR
jgi:hypothetical protein